MSTNLGVQFTGLLPASAVQIARVVEHRGDGVSSIVEFPGGAQIVVQGQGVDVGTNAFVRNAEMLGPAPEVTEVALEV